MKSILFIGLCFCALSASAQLKTFTVYFEDNRADLTAAERTKLENFIDTGMSGVCSNGGFMLHAHTDSRGSNQYNLDLAGRRLETVKGFFVKPNVRVCIAREGIYGEGKLLLDDGGDVVKGSANRRVEILYTNEEPVAVAPPQIQPATAIQDTIAMDPPTRFDTVLIKSPLSVQIEDPNVKVGSTLVLKNLEFYGGRHHILPPSFRELKELVQAMKNNRKLRIALEGHICCEPTRNDGIDLDLNTRDLSFQRAKAVNDFLVYSGINQKRITYRGFGHRYPIHPYPEQTDEERTANRRVEVRIVEK